MKIASIISSPIIICIKGMFSFNKKFSPSVYKVFSKSVLLNILFLLTISKVPGQEVGVLGNHRQNSFSDNLFTGGNFGFTFGQNVAFIEVAPIVGKKLTDNIVVGIGPTYRHIYFKDIYYQYTMYDLKINNYGFSVFGRYYFNSDYIEIFNNIFVHSEVEYNYMYYKLVPKDKTLVEDKGGIDFTNIYMGGGYKQPIGDFSSFNLLILWNLNETPFSPYPNPLLRVGFTIGL